MAQYRVKARNWRIEHQEMLGEEYSLHELTDTEVVELIIRFGRAEILEWNDEDYKGLTLDFQNDYD